MFRTLINLQVMFSLPAEKKWQLYISRKMEQMQHAVVGHHQPDLYLEKIAAFIKVACKLLKTFR